MSLSDFASGAWDSLDVWLNLLDFSEARDGFLGIDHETNTTIERLGTLFGDASGTQFCGEGFENFQNTVKGFHGYLSLVICILGTIMNMLNIIVLTRKEMESPTNSILTGLAAADMLVMLEYIPYACHVYIFNDRPLESRLSYAWSAFVMFHAHFSQIFHTISIWLTVTLAVWRYIAVRFPQRNRMWCDMKSAAAAITSAFVFSPILCIPSFLMFSIHRKKLVHSDETVTSVYVVAPSKMAIADDGILQLVNFWTYSVFIKIVPCVALMVLTYVLVSTMYEAQRRRLDLTSNAVKRGGGDATTTTTSSLAEPLTTTTTAVSKSGGRKQKQTDRTTRMLVAVVVLFLITEIPQGVLGLLSGLLGRGFYETCYHYLGEVMDLLALTNSAINFLLYCCMSSQFRRIFSQLFKPHVMHRSPNANGAVSTAAETQM
ncbi:unnamed protein product [Notodromas monacha]|uniref:G-protein coupled receptors family 1 profile domain-containing protein n=1 Tax=Notodromas monacha TaxID=399045 RepID=A0A7R9BE60_9CRUS|nr:unnamed protein product [Notodromas monacha]CAG0913680.1 unnamed protein product [Notodromas monacha]